MKRFWRGRGLALMLLLSQPSSAEAERITLFEDGFESGDFSAWAEAAGSWRVVTSLSAARSGLRGADITGPNGTDGDVLLVGISSFGYRDLEWEYWWKVRAGLEADDLLVAEWTVDGETWQRLGAYVVLPVGDWQQAVFALPPAADDNPNLAFRLVANFDSGSDRMAFDDFVLSGEAVSEPALGSLLTALALGVFGRPRRRRV